MHVENGLTSAYFAMLLCLLWGLMNEWRLMMAIEASTHDTSSVQMVFPVNQQRSSCSPDVEADRRQSISISRIGVP